MSNRFVAAISVGGVIGGIAFTIFLTQTLLAPLIEKANWFPDNGIVGVLAWLLLYVVLALLVAPASLHKFISGVLFGFWAGWAIAFIGACLGAILPFFLTKKYLYNWVENKLDKKPTLNALRKAVGEDGLRCVFLTRISLVIPYPFLNYGLGLTDVTWKDYLIGNSGMIVPGALYAYWGSRAADLPVAVNEGKDWTYWAAIVASVLLTIWIIVYLRRITLAHIALETSE
ncbi:MAG: TVP38/TMEM64 family protein [Euryarchaeota archaeon]|nr:TVP38/TMEM64 family protein [Euryarchaeota archaeon]MBT4981880.1 TVP38/TMEM64 family protein [Euryarchaeota archaeon]MBT5184342.1 TVP38/TMEM64 family protein [Euryarchaeota archaeon]